MEAMGDRRPQQEATRSMVVEDFAGHRRRSPGEFNEISVVRFWENLIKLEELFFALSLAVIPLSPKRPGRVQVLPITRTSEFKRSEVRGFLRREMKSRKAFLFARAPGEIRGKLIGQGRSFLLKASCERTSSDVTPVEQLNTYSYVFARSMDHLWGKFYESLGSGQNNSLLTEKKKSWTKG